MGTTSTTAAKGDHTHSGYASATHTHPHTSISDWNSATSTFLETTDVESAGSIVSIGTTYERYVCPTQHGHTASDVFMAANGQTSLYTFLGGGWLARYSSYPEFLRGWHGFTKNLEVNGAKVNQGEDGVDRLEFGLDANKWCVTDGNGRLTTTDDTPVALPSDKTGQTTSVTVVTGIAWTNNQIQATRKTLTFTNGVLTGTSNATTQTINTTTYTGT